jgi:hypothetical protein
MPGDAPAQLFVAQIDPDDVAQPGVDHLVVQPRLGSGLEELAALEESASLSCASNFSALACARSSNASMRACRALRDLRPHQAQWHPAGASRRDRGATLIDHVYSVVNTLNL